MAKNFVVMAGNASAVHQGKEWQVDPQPLALYRALQFAKEIQDRGDAVLLAIALDHHGRFSDLLRSDRQGSKIRKSPVLSDLQEDITAQFSRVRL